MLIPVFMSTALAALAWLLPNHARPWPAFHSDLAMAAALGCWLAWVALRRSGAGPWPKLAVWALLLAAVPPIQVALGLIRFGGDGLVTALYIAGFSLAMVGGAAAARLPWTPRCNEVWFGLLLGVCVVSVWVQLDQWLSLGQFGLYGATMDARPSGNLAQANQMATLLVLGVVGALVLHHQRRLGTPALLIVVACLGFGIVMTQSRSAWVEVAVVAAWLAFVRKRVGLRISRSTWLGLGLALLAASMVWRPLVEALLLGEGRALPGAGAGRAEPGTRPTHWLSMVDAISRQPWFGYGWNQVSVAQSRVAADHPFTGEMIEHSHNMLLDLLVWNGVPLGLLIIGALAWWFWRKLTSCRDATAAFLLAAVLAVVAHAMLEFPLEYAYFLLPVGFMMGLVDVLAPSGRSVNTPRWVTGSVTLCVATLVGALAFEYTEAEANLTILRFESARIGTPRVESEAPRLVLLTQLRAYLRFARTEAKPGMPATELDWMRDVAARYGYPPVLFRYALAAGLNGRLAETRRALALQCKFNPRFLLPEARDNWVSMIEKYPELAAVPYPPMP